MPCIQYEAKNFRHSTMNVILDANEIIEEYAAQGYSLTLRQLYYQFVARGKVENSIRSYKNLGSIINDGRLAGYIDWDAIEDRTRNLMDLAHWSSPYEIVSACAQQFRYEKWENQPKRVEVWIEKEALTGVIARICNKWDVPYFACRGYVSQSEQWRAAQRFDSYIDQETVLIHLGDHDPSGMDMTRDIGDRLWKFEADGVEVKRIALNIDQIHEYKPPPNPAKLTDSRAKGYIAEFGSSSWELDALEPSVISDLIDHEINEVIDIGQWNDDVKREKEARAAISVAAGTLTK